MSFFSHILVFVNCPSDIEMAISLERQVKFSEFISNFEKNW